MRQKTNMIFGTVLNDNFGDISNGFMAKKACDYKMESENSRKGNDNGGNCINISCGGICDKASLKTHKNKKLKIVFTGGGTAGHIMPCVALIEQLLGEFEIHYIGSMTGMEKDIISKISGVTYHEITTVKLIRALTPKNLAIPFKLMRGVRQAARLLNEIKPDVVFSKGGFVSLPVTIAAKCPIICHESDRSIGIANRKAAKKAKYFCTSFPETAVGLKNGVFTGSPIRKSLFQPKTAEISGQSFGSGISTLGVSVDSYKAASRPMLLIMGGSLGAKAINDCVESCITRLTQRFDIVHITGKGKRTSIKNPRYTQLEFADNIGELYAAASVVLGRGGGCTLFEIAALKIPSVVIPLSGGQSRGDQVENASYFEKQKLCRVIQECDLSPDRLLKELDIALTDPELRRALSSAKNIDGTTQILSLIRETAMGKNR